MAIAGILASAAGAIQVMGVSQNITILASPEGYGFDGIAVALIANSNPIRSYIHQDYYLEHLNTVELRASGRGSF